MNSTVLIIIILAGFIVLLMYLRRIERRSGTSEELIEWLKSSQVTTDLKLSQNMQVFNERLDHAATVIGNLQKHIGEMSEVGRSMRSLQDFLASPKIRGNLGEQILKEILAQYMPQEMYALQHTFKSGEKVDAIIRTSQGILPIDSKFPLENFQKMHKEDNPVEKKKLQKEFMRDVKKHIQAIAKKYILTDEGTLDYAVMYVPAESVYHEIIHDSELNKAAGALRILIVSPTSFFAYIRSILMAYEGQKIEARAKEILILIRSLKKDYEKTDESLALLTRHLTNAYTQLSQVSRNLLSLGHKMSTTNLLSSETKDKEEKLLEEE